MSQIRKLYFSGGLNAQVDKVLAREPELTQANGVTVIDGLVSTLGVSFEDLEKNVVDVIRVLDTDYFIKKDEENNFFLSFGKVSLAIPKSFKKKQVLETVSPPPDFYVLAGKFLSAEKTHLISTDLKSGEESVLKTYAETSGIFPFFTLDTSGDLLLFSSASACFNVSTLQEVSGKTPPSTKPDRALFKNTESNVTVKDIPASDFYLSSSICNAYCLVKKQERDYVPYFEDELFFTSSDQFSFYPFGNVFSFLFNGGLSTFILEPAEAKFLERAEDIMVSSGNQTWILQNGVLIPLAVQFFQSLQKTNSVFKAQKIGYQETIAVVLQNKKLGGSYYAPKTWESNPPPAKEDSFQFYWDKIPGWTFEFYQSPLPQSPLLQRRFPIDDRINVYNQGNDSGLNTGIAGFLRSENLGNRSIFLSNERKKIFYTLKDNIYGVNENDGLFFKETVIDFKVMNNAVIIFLKSGVYASTFSAGFSEPSILYELRLEDRPGCCSNVLDGVIFYSHSTFYLINRGLQAQKLFPLDRLVKEDGAVQAVHYYEPLESVLFLTEKGSLYLYSLKFNFLSYAAFLPNERLILHDKDVNILHADGSLRRLNFLSKDKNSFSLATSLIQLDESSSLKVMRLRRLFMTLRGNKSNEVLSAKLYDEAGKEISNGHFFKEPVYHPPKTNETSKELAEEDEVSVISWAPEEQKYRGFFLQIYGETSPLQILSLEAEVDLEKDVLAIPSGSRMSLKKDLHLFKTLQELVDLGGKKYLETLFHTEKILFFPEDNFQYFTQKTPPPPLDKTGHDRVDGRRGEIYVFDNDKKKMEFLFNSYFSSSGELKLILVDEAFYG